MFPDAFSLPKIRLAFTITMYEFEATIPTLWSHVLGRATSFTLGFVIFTSYRIREETS
jgi:hypothetical protein